MGHVFEEMTPYLGKCGSTRWLWLLPSLNSGLEFRKHCTPKTSLRTHILQRTLKVRSKLLRIYLLVGCLLTFRLDLILGGEKVIQNQSCWMTSVTELWVALLNKNSVSICDVCVCMQTHLFHTLVEDLERCQKWIPPRHHGKKVCVELPM